MEKLASANVILKSGSNSICLPRYCFKHILICFNLKYAVHGQISPDALLNRIDKVNRAIKLNYGCEFTCNKSIVTINEEEVSCEAITIEDLQTNLNVIKQFAVMADDYPIEW